MPRLDKNNLLIRDIAQSALEEKFFEPPQTDVSKSKNPIKTVTSAIVAHMWVQNKPMNQNRIHALVKSINGASVYQNVLQHLYKMNGQGIIQPVSGSKSLWDLTHDMKDLLGEMSAKELPF